jgi:hypothetical protein
MGDIKVRKLDDWIVGVHQDIAEQAGKSLEQHLRELLAASALEAQKRFAEDARNRLKASREKYPNVRPSVDVIREHREAL